MNRQPLLPSVSIPGLLIAGTESGVGQTVAAGAIAASLRMQGYRVGALKPCGVGCVHRREGLVSEEAELLAYWGDVRFPLDVICPQRYGHTMSPAAASEKEKRPLDWNVIRLGMEMIARESDVMIVDGVSGLMAPMDREVTFLDVACWLSVQTVVVARPDRDTVNRTLLALTALRSAGVRIAGVVVNRYNPERISAADEGNILAIERWGRTRVLTVLPDEPIIRGMLPPGIAEAAAKVDWASLCGLVCG